jgi:ribonucleoside-triphosphate reductase
MYHVRKRNGDSVIFDLSKIQAAITKSFESCGRNYQDTIVEKLAMKAVAKAEQRIKDNLLSVEDIQDAVESVLMSYGYEDVAKAYILYRKQHEKARNAQETVLDYKKTMDGYLQAVDWRVKENSTVTYSLGGLILGNSGAMTANYWLSEIYDEEISNAHRNCDFHIHDLSMLSPYCAGWSLKQLIKEGLGGVKGKIASKPAKHLFTLCNQMVNFLGILQNEWAG